MGMGTGIVGLVVAIWQAPWAHNMAASMMVAIAIWVVLMVGLEWLDWRRATRDQRAQARSMRAHRRALRKIGGGH